MNGKSEEHVQETWKNVPGYEGRYSISDMGRVKSLIGREKALKPGKNNSGYLSVKLFKDGKQKNLLVHRLVYEAFNGSIPAGMEINHVNEVKTDNRLSNLNLLSPKENNNWGTRNQRVAEALSKSVQAFDKKTGNLVGWFKSLTEAVDWLRHNGWMKAHTSGIWKVLNGRCRSCYGYFWKYYV